MFIFPCVSARGMLKYQGLILGREIQLAQGRIVGLAVGSIRPLFSILYKLQLAIYGLCSL